MYIVTGGAGFIGSNLIEGLNQRGIDDILVVDDLSDGRKCLNLADLSIADYMDKSDFLTAIQHNTLGFSPTAIFHEGACSDTTEWDGRFVMRNNFGYSKALLHFCLEQGVPMSYASSASVYGTGDKFIEERRFERPLNMYAYSKWLFDVYVRRVLFSAQTQVVGFRYFNVYGPREAHKGSMASVALHLRHQIESGKNPKLFGAYDGFDSGQQTRDFIYVADVINAKLWFLDHPSCSGIYNLGTGRAEPFQAVADAVIEHFQQGEIEYVNFPEHLKGVYQSFTQADLSQLRGSGCPCEFRNVSQGVSDYMHWLDANETDHNV